MKIWVVLLFALTSSSLRANEYSGEALSLRFPAALSEFAVYGDVAAKGGGAVASKFGSSSNPAAMPWYFPGQYDYVLSTQYSRLDFDTGTHLDFLSAATAFDLESLGTVRLSFGQVSSNDRLARGLAIPYTFTYDLTSGKLEWARRWGAFSFGLGYSYAESETTFRLPKLVLADAIRRSSIARFGLQWQPASQWLVGVIGEYGYAPTHTDFLSPTPFGTVGSKEYDIARQVVVRAGLAYEWTTHAMLHLDYQHGHFWNRTGSLDTDRFSIGADLPVAQFLFLRAGAVLNTRGDFGWTAGFGFYPRRGVGLDVAYQNDVFPQLQREFGHSRTLNVSMSVQF